MSAFPYRCGRLDRHEPHEWTSLTLGADWPQRAYHCGGHILTEMQRTENDAADDAAEERAIVERRES